MKDLPAGNESVLSGGLTYPLPDHYPPNTTPKLREDLVLETLETQDRESTKAQIWEINHMLKLTHLDKAFRPPCLCRAQASQKGRVLASARAGPLLPSLLSTQKCSHLQEGKSD